MEIYDLLDETVKRKASDLHISVNLPPICRINGALIPINDTLLTADDTNHFVKSLLNAHQQETLSEKGEIDLSVSQNDERFRLNIYRQTGTYSLAFRYINSETLNFAELGLPSVLADLCKLPRGLILVTGPTGTGKSTTLAAMIDWINKNRNCHVISLEEPIEYIHHHNKCIINQREIGLDSLSFVNALRASLREDPDVILIGEMRDLETISIALTAAETGHLVLSTLHTIGAAKTIDRIIDVFPPYQQQQVRVQLAMVLQAVISQQLLPKADISGRVPAVEIMLANLAIRNLIRDSKTHQISNIILTNAGSGMKTMDTALVEMARRGSITIDDAFAYCVDHEYMKKMFSM